MTEELPDHAINRVLAAEEAVRAEIARCSRQAELIRRQANESARRISDRVERRIALVNSLGDACLRRELASIKAKMRAYSGEPDTEDERARLGRVIDALAREMLGAGR